MVGHGADVRIRADSAWNVPEAECRDALAHLIRSRLLRSDANGQYCLAYRRR